VFDYILHIYLFILYHTTFMSHLKINISFMFTCVISASDYDRCMTFPYCAYTFFFAKFVKFSSVAASITVQITSKSFPRPLDIAAA